MVRVVVIIYLIAILVIGVYMSKRAKSQEDYFIAGKKAPYLVAIISGSAAIMSGFGLVGIPGLAYQFGIAAMWIQVIAILGFSIAAFLVGRKMRTLAEIREVLSIPDAVALRYPSVKKTIRVLSIIGIMSGMLGYLSVEFMALGVVLSSLFAISFWTGALIGAAIVSVYTILGGIASGIWTDLIQFAMEMLAGIAVLIATFVVVGNPYHMLSVLAHAPDPKMQAHAMLWWPQGMGGIGLAGAVAWLIAFSIGHSGEPHLLAKYYVHRDIRKMKWQGMLNGITYGIAGLMSLSGLALAALVAEGKVKPLASSNYAAPYFLLHYTPSIIAGLAFAALAAASMATVNGFSNIGAAAISRDLIQNTFGVQLTPRKGLLLGRVMTFVVIVLALVVTYFWNSLIGIAGAAAWSTLASVFVPCIAIGLNWKRATGKGAVAGATVGVVTSIWFTVANYNPGGFFGSTLAIVLAVIAFVLVSLVTRPETLDREIERVIGMPR
ncbi:sodium:solute symporter [Sulfoacidibacillus thermotolerans]|uniref:Sodium:solute symporter n=2 Tax=Sulfoacidibacillus thermotolerans TaxID=1765684 RepID=A0A2U3D9C8_SULT2|nr:sodium:solute symporter [Sulfoacidibacillus thermotolerans]